MTLVKWTPRPMNISNDFDDMFKTVFHSNWKYPLKTKPNWKPEIDIKESDNLFQIKADIPGLTKKDIKVSLKGDQLTISGEREKISDNENDHYHYRERSIGKFKRSFNLPESINKDKIQASFKNGILSIELEKHEEIEPKEMEISIS
ncbi:MAG: Hsp20/alpha crystallin family protein [Candidatus Neomarinimicrobiota bacterium]